MYHYLKIHIHQIEIKIFYYISLNLWKFKSTSIPSFRPDIAMLQNRGALPAVPPSSIPPPMASFTGPNLEDLEAPRRQTSMDGEAIRIVIHDVDSGPICASKRRIILRRDPTDKAHRSEYRA